jgi:large subunit ribosomal protein L19
MLELVKEVEESYLRSDIPVLASGDTARVHVKVIEGNRERPQVFEGIIIRLHGGGINRSFTVRAIRQGVGVERTFLVNSPRIEKIEVVRHAVVRRKQLYYMRGLSGKAARLRERREK